jgi:hypothetical protein
MMRGPDYADQLTESERRTLNLLLQHVGPAGQMANTSGPGGVELGRGRRAHDAAAARDIGVGGRPGRSAWRQRIGIAVSAAAVAGIALSTSLVTMHPGAAPASPAPVATTSTPSTMDVLRALSEASRASGPSSALAQASAVVVATQKGSACAVNAYQVVTAMKVATAWPPVTVEIGRIGEPSRSAPWLSCVEVGSEQPNATPYQKVFEGATGGDGPAGWNALLARVRQSVLVPDLLDPRAIPDGLAVGTLSSDPATLATALDKVAMSPPGGSTGWWTAVVQLLSSPLCPPTVRSTVLSMAADASRSADVRVVVDRPTDILGRPGTTLRVPYSVDGVAAHADLTFAITTGALLQRTVYAPPGQRWSMVITANR